MRERGERFGGPVILAGLGGFLLGAATVLFILWLYESPSVPPAPPPQDDTAEVEATPEPAPPEVVAPAVPGASQPTLPSTRDLESKRLLVPVQGMRADQLANTFDDARDGGRVHGAMDIIAPRNTPVLAVEDGKVAKLFNSQQGGLTIYQFDPTETYAYYYAHLERYAPGVQEGMQVRRGQVIGYVGTSGNAGPDNPHLHFAIFRLTPEKKWWQGEPVNPYGLLGR